MSLNYFRSARLFLCVTQKSAVRPIWLRPLATGNVPTESKLPSSHSGQEQSVSTPQKPVTKPTWGEYLFEEGWRRPLKVSEGAVMRRNWVSWGFNSSNEHTDWLINHIYVAMVVVGVFCWFFFIMLYRQDWPDMREWARREAHIEMARREKFGLPYISPDYIDRQKVLASLPSDEELGDFPVVV